MTMTTDAQQHPMPAQPAGDDHGWNIGRAVLMVGVLGLAIGAVIFGGRTITLNGEKDTAVQQANTQGQAKDNVAERAIALCTNATPEELQKLNGVGLCVAAAQAKNQDPPAAPATVPFSLVKVAVDAYFAANPPKEGPVGPLPPEDAVLRFVKQVYEANKPADGKTPTDDELLTLIRQVYAADPPKDGVDGADGAAGQNAHCFDVPDDPACRPQKGDPGVSVTDIQLDPSGGCELVVLFSDGTNTRKPVNPALCGPAVPPSTTTTETVTADPPLPLPTS